MKLFTSRDDMKNGKPYEPKPNEDWLGKDLRDRNGITPSQSYDLSGVHQEKKKFSIFNIGKQR